MTTEQHGSYQPSESAIFVGRVREQARLRQLLGGALRSNGSLVLISGEAGIGKTTVVRSLASDAERRGFMTLTGHCYDRSVTPPFGPWREIIDAGLRQTDMQEVPRILQDRQRFSNAVSRNVLFRELEHFLTRIASEHPLMLVLEDLHWADPGSLDFLRMLARQLAGIRMLVVGTFRQDDLAPGELLYMLMPVIVRETGADRIKLQPLERSMVRDLVARRYHLASNDEERLVAYLESRGEGIPFFLLELLRTLEEERRLESTDAGWTLRDLQNIHVPLLIRQVIDGRLARLGARSREILELAAVIGQEVPLPLWRDVGDAGDDAFAIAIEGAVQASLMYAAPDGATLAFSHALVREALYAGTPLLRRQSWHRAVAEALARAGDDEPEVIAFHFEQALDPRAADWFVHAGERVEHIAAVTAASHFESALNLMGTSSELAGKRGWLVARRARLLRTADPQLSVTLLDSASLLALDADDRLLLTYVKYYRGQTRCLNGELELGIADLEASMSDLASLTAQDEQRLSTLEEQGVVPHRSEVDGLLASELAMVGRISEALKQTGRAIERAGRLPSMGWLARGVAFALAGDPIEASQAFRRCQRSLRGGSRAAMSGIALLLQIFTVQLPYKADDLAARNALTRGAVTAWQDLIRVFGDSSPARIARLPDLQLEGRWREARELALSGVESSGTSAVKRLISIVSLAQLARAQGEPELADNLVHELLPDGPFTEPGTSVLPTALALQRVAFHLHIDSEDLTGARDWLAAHDRWLDWSGAILGKADGQLAWAHYNHAYGDLSRAREAAKRALTLASHPRQPLVMLASHRYLGYLLAESGLYDLANEHLQRSLSLAMHCAAPYERALTLTDIAALQIAQDRPDHARPPMEEAHQIAASLEAAPLLSRLDALLVNLNHAVVKPHPPRGLSPREIDVLRHIAAGQRNREIARDLGISVRTVERHVTNIFNKITVSSRAEAIAFAHHNDLI